MKQLSMAAACAACLAFAAPAWANDVAQITQTGSANTASIEQTASRGLNTAAVRQGDEWHDSTENQARVTQHDVDNAFVDLYQSGFNNSYTVFQHEGGDLRVNINTDSANFGGIGESNSVTVDQSGIEMRAWVEQGGSMLSRADIVQSGWGNAASIVQSGVGNQASIFQASAGVSAMIIQGSNGFSSGFGAGNTATIRQGY